MLDGVKSDAVTLPTGTPRVNQMAIKKRDSKVTVIGTLYTVPNAAKSKKITESLAKLTVKMLDNPERKRVSFHGNVLKPIDLTKAWSDDCVLTALGSKIKHAHAVKALRKLASTIKKHEALRKMHKADSSAGKRIKEDVKERIIRI